MGGWDRESSARAAFMDPESRKWPLKLDVLVSRTLEFPVGADWSLSIVQRSAWGGIPHKKIFGNP